MRHRLVKYFPPQVTFEQKREQLDFASVKCGRARGECNSTQVCFRAVIHKEFYRKAFTMNEL